jgi:glycosyltransferase involved in cell wall biosynthesis
VKRSVGKKSPLLESLQLGKRIKTVMLYNWFMRPSVELVIPVLNESQTLEIQIQKLEKYLEAQTNLQFSYRITIADNGSTDSTLSIARSLADRFQNIDVSSVDSRGVGLALKTAWQNSDCDFVGYIDLDFSTDLKHLRDVETLFISGYECIFGSRLLAGSVVSGRSLKRSVTSKVFNRLIRRVFNSTLSDGMCGFKFVKKDQLSKILQNGAECDGWFFCTELTVIAQQVGCKIIEIPVKWDDDRNSKVKIPSLTYEYISDIIRLKKRITRPVNSKIR